MARYGEAERAQARALKAEGLSNRQIADRLMIGRRTIDGWLSSEPVAAQPPATEQQGEGTGAAGGPGHQAAGEQPVTRLHERPPRKPSGGKVQPKPAVSPDGLDYPAISGYIEAAYKIGGKLAAERGDAVLSEVISEHAGAAAKAWTRWIQSEPRVEELLRKLMVGTPMGEVIAIHVSIVFSYTLARGAAAALAAEARAAAEAEEALARARNGS